WTALPAGASVTLNGNVASFSFLNPGLPANPTNTVSVRDANNTSIAGSSNGFSVSGTETLTINPISPQNANTPFPVSGTISNPNSQPSASTDFSVNPGQDGSYWKQPFQSTANWITSGPLITALRDGTPSINLKGNFSVPWYRG